MFLEIPLKYNIPNQSFNVLLNNQNVTIDLLTVGGILYVNLYVGSATILYGMRAINKSYINQYISIFNGYLFFDCEDGLDPTYDRLGNICKLYYADYDALAIDYQNWLQQNSAELIARIGI